MRFIDNLGITDPTLNLALEEYVLRHKPVDDDCLLFYINAPSIIIGRNQNTVEEINAPVVDARGITVVRRISGGGAVYHDLGNLNFSFITPFEHGRFNRYDHFTKPVLATLHALGVPAELGGRNDILAEGRKISGNAQFATATRMFSHGTLLFDSNLDDVTEALRPKPGKVESKGVKSIRSRVANISEFVRDPITVGELRPIGKMKKVVGHPGAALDFARAGPPQRLVVGQDRLEVIRPLSLAHATIEPTIESTAAMGNAMARQRIPSIANATPRRSTARTTSSGPGRATSVADCGQRAKIVQGIETEKSKAIVKAIKEKGLFSLDDVRKHTKASASCGSCTGLVEQILASCIGGAYQPADTKNKPMCNCTDLNHGEVRAAMAAGLSL